MKKTKTTERWIDSRGVEHWFDEHNLPTDNSESQVLSRMSQQDRMMDPVNEQDLPWTARQAFREAAQMTPEQEAECDRWLEARIRSVRNSYMNYPGDGQIAARERRQFMGWSDT